jgi:hypothetical protein
MVEVLRDTHISKYHILSQGLFSQCSKSGSDRAWLRRIEDDLKLTEERRRSSSDESADPILVSISYKLARFCNV